MVKRYTFVELAHIRQMGTEAFVDAADYDAIAAELAETQRQLKMVAPIGTYNGRDIEGWAKHAGALEAAMREHNEGCQALCGIGDQEAVACGYRPYFENSGRRCPNCPTYDIIDFPVETPAPDYDPTPWCSGCGAMRKADCKCGPIAENEE